ncbi:DNA internalization-related competence protein ComEC/Rec2 [Acidovorax sp. NCPPB 3576]|uniref:DNA internalization-related competence protein ComEC/Rec2 n=1 Tax=Acidovorax sp. NCPPB 3576 TaxID=2940488 RepID=UPI00234909F7|nr:DNA internalization-related competence protein ComEC/Rec2 [Acidovorax sp. NCPPB 3576]WCM89727.1 DNA internalization-related competence protein ComEC/Rec2 [Acidovorax sp. NCPPB 3576]
MPLPSPAFAAPATPAVARPWRWPWWLGGVLAGAALQLMQAALWPLAVYAVAALGGLLAAIAAAVPSRRMLPAWCRSRGWMFAAGLVFMAGATGLRALVFLQGALPPALEGRDIHLVGVVAAMPQTGESGVRLRMVVESALLDGRAVAVPALIDVAWYVGAFGEAPGAADVRRLSTGVRAGERWRMTVRLKAPHGLRNPQGFDAELAWWEQGVQATGYVRTGARDEPPLRLEATWQYPVQRARQAVRDAILAHLAPVGAAADSDDGGTAARARAAGVVAALVTGDQRAIDRADWDVFRATGVAHLVSISGLHITLFAWLAATVVGAFWRRVPRLCLAVPAPTAALAGGVLLAWAYAVFSGWGVPAQRTVCMLATVALLRLSGRRWPWPHVWLLACAVVVLADPWALLQAGFWLSFVAVAVLFATDSIAKEADRSRASGRLVSMLREQWVVTLALTPLTLLLFGQVSIVGLLANLVAIPWITLLVTPLALGGTLWAPLWTAAAWCVLPFAGLLQWLAALPWAAVSLPAAPVWAGVAGVAGGTLLALRWPWPLRALGVPLLIPVLWWQPHRPLPGQFELLAADVGQGQAVLVRTAHHAMLYDAGPRYGLESDAGDRVLVPLLRSMGERIDLLMLSHRDTDHTGGAAAVLAQQPQAGLMGSIENEHALQQLRPAVPCLAGQRWAWDGVLFELLHPLQAQAHDDAPQAAPRPAVRPNTLSCVLRITAAPSQEGAPPSALLAGDIEQAQESALLARGAIGPADVLLVPHHGSKTSSTAAFLDAVRPRTALVQAGYRNRFGHPAPDVVARYRERGAVLLDSPRCGAATWASEAPREWRCERDAGRRYWHHAPAPLP